MITSGVDAVVCSPLYIAGMAFLVGLHGSALVFRLIPVDRDEQLYDHISFT
jgi:hypothetical protein